MARKQVVVCDVCERVDRETEHWRITHAGRRYELELCAEHSKSLEKLVSRVSGRRATPIRFQDSITTMEDLERRKRENAS